MTPQFRQSSGGSVSGGTNEDRGNRKSDRAESDVRASSLSVAVAIDTSGSMALSPTESVPEEPGSIDPIERSPSKLELIGTWVPELLSTLDGRDQLGIVRYNTTVAEVHELSKASTYDVETLRSRLASVRPSKGANLTIGFERAVEMVAGLPATGTRRVLLVTDSLPSADPTTSPILRNVRAAAESGIYVTYVYVGSDPSAELEAELSGMDRVSQRYVQSGADLTDPEGFLEES